METSILKSVKKMLGLEADDASFDSELIDHINSVLAGLTQIGFSSTLQIEDDTAVWDDLLNGNQDLNFVKSYVAQKVKYIWDPPSGSAMESLKSVISEYEWRINVQLENEVN